MANPGGVFSDPVTGERCVVRSSASTKPPRAVQKVAFAVLAPTARATGRRATYAHHRGVVISPA